MAFCDGAGDFLGGSQSRRLPLLSVILGSQSWGLLAAIVLVVALGDPLASSDDLVLGAVAGAVALVALGLLYGGLSVGRMAVVAPLSAVGSGVLPVVWGLTHGERPSGLALVGVVIVLVAAATIGRSAEEESRSATSGPMQILLGLGAGCALGVFFILLSETDPSSGLWPILAVRVATSALVACVVVISRPAAVRRAAVALPVAGAGVLTLVANALLLLAVRRDLLTLVVPVAALYPAGTVILARVVLRERVGRRSLVGLALALVGLVMIASR